MKKKNTYLYRYFLIYFIIVSSAIMMTYALMFNTSNDVHVRRLLMIPLLIVIFFITNIFALYLLKRIFILNRRYEKSEMELLKYQYLESDLKLYRQHRHDMKNHLIIIYEMVKDKKYDDLEDYTQQYIKKTSNKLMNIHSGVDELDILFYNKIDLAKQSNIPLDFRCNSQMSIHHSAIIDVVSILSNLLDNAIDANRAIMNPKDRMISINIDEDQLDYIFVITNAFTPSSDVSSFVKDGFTTKQDYRNHGLGLGIIHKLVDRYKGKIYIDVFNNKFYQVKIELPKHFL
ncbi:MAG: GHKL domain-containing protein [Clostridia bacterium]|nr:GHKL domain-containing protein [Clostridia bacterium]